MSDLWKKLTSILGHELTQRVCEVLGGKTVRIRKSYAGFVELYESRRLELDQKSIRKAAKALGCNRQTICRIRRQIKKTF
jgi:hypothetical protein